MRRRRRTSISTRRSQTRREKSGPASCTADAWCGSIPNRTAGSNTCCRSPTHMTAAPGSTIPRPPLRSGMSITTATWSGCSLGNERIKRCSRAGVKLQGSVRRAATLAPTPNIATEKKRTESMARARFTFLSSLILTPLVALAGTSPVRCQEAKAGLSITAKPGEWRYLNGDPMSTRYSPLAQINKDNFKDLKIAWRWKPAIGPAPPSLGGTAQGNGDPKLAIYKSESTPIMANGVLYTAAGGQRVVAAIDAATGRQLWMWMGMDEGGRYRKAPRRNAGRG